MCQVSVTELYSRPHFSVLTFFPLKFVHWQVHGVYNVFWPLSHFPPTKTFSHVHIFALFCHPLILSRTVWPLSWYFLLESGRLISVYTTEGNDYPSHIIHHWPIVVPQGGEELLPSSWLTVVNPFFCSPFPANHSCHKIIFVMNSCTIPWEDNISQTFSISSSSYILHFESFLWCFPEP